MYCLWKWLESYNNCTFSTWKEKRIFNVLFWILNSLCVLHYRGRGGTPSLATPEVTLLIFVIHDFELALALNKSFPRNFLLHWNIFYPSGFWTACACPEKQCAQNSLYWIDVFYHSEFWPTCACPENIVCPKIFHSIEIQ